VISIPAEFVRLTDVDSFVHEGITTGLKGGRLHLDDGDLDTIQDSIHNRAVVLNSNHFRSSVKLATAPINLAVSSFTNVGCVDSVARVPSDQQGLDWSFRKAREDGQRGRSEGGMGIAREVLGGV
jgi:hypothetical protein